MIQRTIALSIGILTLIGCSANWDSIYRETNNDVPKTSYIDAKQRAIISNKREDKKQLVVCAEKSPDVFSVLSSSASGSVEAKKEIAQAAAKFAASSSESGSNIGLRTQLTQAQSEFLYRLCEQYMNGSIGQATVETELRRFPTTIVALLAIEQLTGYAKPNYEAIGGQATAGMVGSLTALQKAVDLAKADDEQKQAGLADASKKATEAQKALDEKNAAKQKLIDSVDTTQADKDIKEAATALKAAQDKKTTDVKVVEDDAKPIAAAQATVAQKIAAKKSLAAGADTAQADKEISDATAALKALQDKKVTDAKTVEDDTKLIADAENTLKQKTVAKKKLVESVDTAQADKDIKDAASALQAAVASKKSAENAAKDTANNLKQIAAARDGASSALSASTSSTPAQFFDAKASRYFEGDKQNVQAVAGAVTDIVKMVTTQTFTTEVCLKAFFEDSEIYKVRDADKLFKFCSDWISDVNKWKFQNLYLARGVMPDGLRPIPVDRQVPQAPMPEGPYYKLNFDPITGEPNDSMVYLNAPAVKPQARVPETAPSAPGIQPAR